MKTAPFCKNWKCVLHCATEESNRKMTEMQFVLCAFVSVSVVFVVVMLVWMRHVHPYVWFAQYCKTDEWNALKSFVASFTRSFQLTYQHKEAAMTNPSNYHFIWVLSGRWLVQPISYFRLSRRKTYLFSIHIFNYI